MMVFGVLTLVLSWTSLGADLATAVVSCFTSSPPDGLTQYRAACAGLRSTVITPDSDDKLL